MDEAKLRSCIGDIYKAPGNPVEWQKLTFELVKFFEAEYNHIGVCDRPGNIYCDFVSEPSAGEEYGQHYAALDVALHRVLRGAERKAATQFDVMSPDELKKCPVQQELLPKFNASQRLWAKSRIDNDFTCISAIIRSPRQADFDAEHYQLLELLHPHIERAMRLHLELEKARNFSPSLEIGLDALATGLLLLNADGTVLFANRAAHVVLEANHGLRMKNNKLIATKLADNAKLQAILAQSLVEQTISRGGGVSLSRRHGRPLILRVLPTPPNTSILTSRTAAVVLLHDPDRALDANQATLMVMGLTPAEARCVIALTAGTTVDLYARQAELSEHTVRSMLKSIFTKTGTGRQSELIALIMRTACLP